MGSLRHTQLIMVTQALLCLLALTPAVYCGVPKCDTVFEEKCWDEPRQQCSTVQKPYTTTAYEQECHPEYDQKCTTVYDTKVDHVPRQSATLSRCLRYLR